MSPKTVDSPSTEKLVERIVAIVEEAKTNVVRAVNSSMVIAYWLICRELVRTIQKGDERAEYGKEIVNQLSARLNRKFGKGFSATNLWYFRQFYLAYAERTPEIRPVSTDKQGLGILHKPCGESGQEDNLTLDRKSRGVLDDLSVAVGKGDAVKGFCPNLSWSHYRTLAKVKRESERLF